MHLHCHVFRCFCKEVGFLGREHGQFSLSSRESTVISRRTGKAELACMLLLSVLNALLWNEFLADGSEIRTALGR
jgi:hypothetical protein